MAHKENCILYPNKAIDLPFPTIEVLAGKVQEIYVFHQSWNTNKFTLFFGLRLSIMEAADLEDDPKLKEHLDTLKRKSVMPETEIRWDDLSKGSLNQGDHTSFSRVTLVQQETN